MYQQILVGIDGTECAMKAVCAAGEIARAFDSSVTVLYVARVPDALQMSYVMPGAGLSEEAMEDCMDGQRDPMVCRAASRLKEMGVNVTVRCEAGPPCEEIVRVAREEQADLIVLGSHCTSDWAAHVRGSVPDYVAHNTACAVLLAK